MKGESGDFGPQVTPKETPKEKPQIIIPYKWTPIGAASGTVLIGSLLHDPITYPIGTPRTAGPHRTAGETRKEGEYYGMALILWDRGGGRL